MEPRFEILKEKKLVGEKIQMSFANNKTGELWRNFMSGKNEIKNKISSDLISLQVYGKTFDFKPHSEFEKWALIEVSDFDNIPGNMETFLLKEGLYAVFHYKGSGLDNRIFQYIFSHWLPDSDYLLDDRPHFEVLGKKYKNADPDSEEEIWIPIKPKK